MGEVSIPSGAVELQGVLDVPAQARGIVVFSHGSGSGRFSTRNRYVAAELRKAGIATLLLDLLTEEEDQVYENRFDIPRLTERLGDAVRFAARRNETRALPVGLFGASTGAASALRVAASTTIAPNDKPLMMRFRCGKVPPFGTACGGASLIKAPLWATSAAKPSCSGG